MSNEPGMGLVAPGSVGAAVGGTRLDGAQPTRFAASQVLPVAWLTAIHFTGKRKDNHMPSHRRALCVGINKFKYLPQNAQRYIRRLEELLDCPASLISVGKHREQTIVRKSVF